jgi:hypothetical protein
LSPRRLTFLFALGISLWVPAASASAVPLPSPDQPGFGISPARQEVIGTPPLELASTTVLNGTGRTVQVTAFPVLLKQDLTGAFYFSSTARALNNSKLVLTAEPSSFTLTPGQSQQVGLRWNLLPPHQPWVAVGVVYQGIPKQQAGPVHVITRLLGVDFLRLPGNYRISGQLAGLFPEQGGPQVLRFLPRVRNTGEIFAAPSAGNLVIRDSGGNRVLSQLWSGSVVLPGASVDFPILVKHVLPAGHYTATVTMNFGGPRSLTVPFTLVGPNGLPTPAITIQNLDASGVVGSPARLKAKLISNGTAPVTVAVRLFLGTQAEGPGQSALASKTITYRDLRPGAVVRLSQPLGVPLKKGSYRAILTWNDPTGAPHTLESDFVTTNGRSFLQKLWDLIRHNLVLFIGLLVIALSLGLAYVFNQQRQKQRRMEAELAAARAAIERARPAPLELSARRAGDGHGPEHEPDGQPAPDVDDEATRLPGREEPPEVEDYEVEQPAEIAPAQVAEVAPAPPPGAATTVMSPAPDSDTGWIPPWERERRENGPDDKPAPSSERPSS